MRRRLTAHLVRTCTDFEYKTDHELRSLDFEANGYGEEAVSELITYMDSFEPLPEVLMRTYSWLFLDYCMLKGGHAGGSKGIHDKRNL